MRLSLETSQQLYTHFTGLKNVLCVPRSNIVSDGEFSFYDDEYGCAVSWLIAKQLLGRTTTLLADMTRAVEAVVKWWLAAKPRGRMTPTNIRVGMEFLSGAVRYKVTGVRRTTSTIEYDEFTVPGTSTWHSIEDRVYLIADLGTAVGVSDVKEEDEPRVGDILTPKNAAPGVEFIYSGMTYRLRELKGEPGSSAWYIDRVDGGGRSTDWWDTNTSSARITAVPTAHFGWVPAPEDPPKKDPKDRLRCRCHGYLKCTVRDYEESQRMTSSLQLNATAHTPWDQRGGPRPEKETAKDILEDLKGRLLTPGIHKRLRELEAALKTEAK